ncbi:unnamed protein product, partial [marine sediment metagenome]
MRFVDLEDIYVAPSNTGKVTETDPYIVTANGNSGFFVYKFINGNLIFEASVDPGNGAQYGILYKSSQTYTLFITMTGFIRAYRFAGGSLTQIASE